MKPDFPRADDAKHQRIREQHGEDFAERMLQLNERNYFVSGLNRCVVLVNEVVQAMRDAGITPTARMLEIQADLIEMVKSDPHPVDPKPKDSP